MKEVGIVALFRQQSKEAWVIWLLRGKDVEVLDQRIESLYLTYKRSSGNKEDSKRQKKDVTAL